MIVVVVAKQTKDNFSSDTGLLQPDGAGPEPVDLEEDEDFEEFGILDDQQGEEEEESGNDYAN